MKKTNRIALLMELMVWLVWQIVNMWTDKVRIGGGMCSEGSEHGGTAHLVGSQLPQSAVGRSL